METNENTIPMDGQEENQNKAQNKNKTQKAIDKDLWKKVSFGTASGILLGAGAVYAVDHIGGDEHEIHHVHTDDDNGTQPPIYNQAPVAHVSDSMSFSQAFAAARAQVGAGGVFSWHGGIYGTYYETEWNAMSPAQRAAYAHSVNPEVRAQHVDTTHVNEHHPDVTVNTNNNKAGRQQGSDNDNQTHDNHDPNNNKTDNNEHNNNGKTHHNGDGEQQQEGRFLADDEDVHVLGRTTVQGHEAVAVDVDGDNQPDAVIIDVDDSHTLTERDVVILRDGRQLTAGELAEAQGNGYTATDVETVEAVEDISDNNDTTEEDAVNTNYTTEDPYATQASMENPDVAPDMPNYLDDINPMV